MPYLLVKLRPILSDLHPVTKTPVIMATLIPVINPHKEIHS